MVRIIEPQVDLGSREIIGSEADELLLKYGYKQNTKTEPDNANNDLTFEELIRLEEEKRKPKPTNAPRPISFDSDNYYTETKWSEDEDSGIGFKVEIVSNMRF